MFKENMNHQLEISQKTGISAQYDDWGQPGQ